MNFNQIIETLKEKQGLKNSDEIAEYLELSRAGYFFMKNGRGGLSEKTLHKIMVGTGMDAVTITAAWMAKNAKDKTVRESWKKWLSTAAAVTLLSVSIPHSETQLSNKNMEPSIYIM